jgi:hypothetical protein
MQASGRAHDVPIGIVARKKNAPRIDASIHWLCIGMRIAPMDGAWPWS